MEEERNGCKMNANVESFYKLQVGGYLWDFSRMEMSDRRDKVMEAKEVFSKPFGR